MERLSSGFLAAVGPATGRWLQLTRDRQLQKFMNVLGAVDVHDALPQFLALILPDYVAAKRDEFHGDFFLGHRIARIALGHIHTSGIRFAVIRRDGHATRLELREERFEFFVGDYFYLVHDRNQRLVQHTVLFELQGCYHSVDQPDCHAIRQRMICGFLRAGSILVWITKNVSGTRDHFYFDFLYVIRLNLVFLDGFHHGSERRMTQRFDWETFHPAIEDPTVRFRRYRQIFDQTFAIEACRLSFVLDVTEHRKQTFFPIDHVFRSGESFAREQRALGAHAAGPRIDRVLHVGQLARRDRARTKRPRGADPDRRHHLIGREIEHASRRYRRRERAQRCVMPAVFTNSRPPDFAKPHLNFIGDDCSKD